jgi:PAS domain S-box-containing protein
MEYRLRRHDGEYRWILDIGVPRFNQDRSFAGCIGIGFDITERKRTEEALRASQEQLQAIWNNSPAILFIKDRQGRYLDHNPGFLKRTSLSHEQILGKTDEEIFPPEQAAAFRANDQRILEENRAIECEETAQQKDGIHTSIVQKFPLRDAQGQPYAICGIITDITERKWAEESLRQKERELLEAQRLAGVGSWKWDARKDEVTWSEELYRIAGLDPKLPAPSYKEIPQFYTPESWERLQPAVEKALRDGASYELDLEVVRSDGTTRWVRTRGEAMGDTTGRIVGLRGTAQDITERKLAEEALAGMSRKLLEAQEQERARIGRELHDDINQRLALLSVEIQRMKDVAPATYGDLRSRMDELGKRTSEISAVVQSLSHELHSSTLEYLGLVSAMKRFCRDFGDKH